MDDWDWELLHDSQGTESDAAKVDELKKSASSSTSSVCDDCGVIRSDYFSLDSHRHHNKFDDHHEEDESSDNASWIDPSNSMSLSGRRREKIRSSCSNSDSSDPSDSAELGNETPIPYAIDHGSVQTNMTQSVEQGSEGKGYESEGDQRVVSANSGDSSANAVVQEEERESGLVSKANEEKKVLWWRVPLEVLKYCVMRVNPVWSLSMAAAAVMGLVILRRRYLHKMKRKTHGLQLKVTVDDKKVSQFMTRVGQLNEAFSVVKRVPIIRPSLPAPGLTLWPVVSLR